MHSLMTISQFSSTASFSSSAGGGHCVCPANPQLGSKSWTAPISSCTAFACKLLCIPVPNFASSPCQQSRVKYCPLPSSKKCLLGWKLQFPATWSSDFSSSRETSGCQSRPVYCRDSLPGKVGGSAKQNVVPDQDLVESRVEEDVGSPEGSSSFGGSPSSPETNTNKSSSFKSLSEMDEQLYNEHDAFAVGGLDSILQTLILICPFFLWGTAMVAMKGLLPKAGPMFVASVRLIPAGFLLIGYGALVGKKQPAGFMAWLSIALFGLVDGSCFQGFLTEGLKKTSAGLGSVIIDSQPLTVAVLAALIFGESLDVLNYAGLALGIFGLLLLEMPADVLQNLVSSAGELNISSLISDTTGVNGLVSWERGEWRMLVAAQSMAIGTVMIRWVCKYSDPFMATGWHMVLGGIPLLVLSVVQQDPALNGHIQDLTGSDWSALLYTSVGGSAISYGVFFYNATRGSLTKLSSLTFLTPMFAALFGFLFLNETLSPVQFLGGVVTVGGVLLVNYKPSFTAQLDDVNKDKL